MHYININADGYFLLGRVAPPGCNPFPRLAILTIQPSIIDLPSPPDSQNPLWLSQTTSFPQVHPPNYRVHISDKTQPTLCRGV